MFQNVSHNGLDLGHGGPPLLDLRFADDILLFAGSAEQLGHMLDKLVTSLEKGQCWLGILEHAMRKRKLRVQHCGPHCGDDELLTNVRYADDLMPYARSDLHLATMVDCLVEELAAVGLNLATSTTNLNEPMFLNISGDMIEIRHGEQNHKYL